MTQTNEAPTQQITANHNPNLDSLPTKFHFRKVKDEATGVESKRPTVEIPLVVPSVEGVVEILRAGGKELDLLMEAVQSVVVSRAREIINEKEDITVDNFPYAELLWEKLANMPKSERRGSGIAKEVWEDFAKDYITVMPALTGKTEEQVTNATKIYLNKFALIKANKPVIKALKDQLTVYLNGSPNAESYSDCLELLLTKADNYIEADEFSLVANL